MPDIPDIANQVAGELMARGACAVWLAGSYARGDADRHSDIDIGALFQKRPEQPGPRLARRNGYLVSVVWVTAEQTRASFRAPFLLGAAVPGWRRAVILRDPDHSAAALRDEALRWSWDAEIEASCDVWVASQIESLAEYAQKLQGCIDRGKLSAAAAHRSLLATRLPLVLAVHRRLLHDGENDVLGRVAEAVGEPWATEQPAALGLRGESLARSCMAALRLYAIAAAETAAVLDERQRAIVELGNQRSSEGQTR